MSLHNGDCIEVMAGMEPESVDAIVTDPPYGLGFMGKAWDHGVPAREFWAEMLRVARPSAYLLAFGGTRTVHRIATNIEDAGWVIRDMLVWAYASGFPKSKASLKPAWEPIVMARKPGPLRMLAIDECRIGVEAMPSLLGELGANGVYGRMERRPVGGPTTIMDAWDDERNLCGSCAEDAGYRERPGTSATRASTTRRRAVPSPSGQGMFGDTSRAATGFSGGTTADDTGISSSTDGSGNRPTGLSRRVTSSTTSTATSSTTGSRTCSSCGATSTGTITTDDMTSTPSDHLALTTSDDAVLGRWPSNCILTDPIFDGGWEGVVGGGETSQAGNPTDLRGIGGIWHEGNGVPAGPQYGDSGTYSRFFLIPKASRSDREPVLGGLPMTPSLVYSEKAQGPLPQQTPSRPSARANQHPTVKPTDLMRHLVRLVTPTGGTVLDPFLGSGTTALAAEMEGFAWIGIEREAEYVAIAEARLNGTQRGLGLAAS